MLSVSVLGWGYTSLKKKIIRIVHLISLFISVHFFCAVKVNVSSISQVGFSNIVSLHTRLQAKFRPGPSSAGLESWLAGEIWL